MQISRYRKAVGPSAPKFLDFPLVLLTTVGARTGREFTHPLGGFEQEDGTWLVVASKSGASTHPGWFINPCKSPDNVWLEVGNRKIKVRPTLLKGKERDAALAKDRRHLTALRGISEQDRPRDPDRQPYSFLRPRLGKFRVG